MFPKPNPTTAPAASRSATAASSASQERKAGLLDPRVDMRGAWGCHVTGPSQGPMEPRPVSGRARRHLGGVASRPLSSEMFMDVPFVSTPRSAARRQEVHLTEDLLTRLLGTTTATHAAGLKSFGLLLADPLDPRFPFVATDVVFFDPTKNRRNDPAMRSAFEAQGEYFRAYDDAGFVADSAELLEVHRRLDAWGLEAVALFHVHRRQPANFS